MSDAGREDQAARAGAALVRLIRLVERLRAPDGCPWDQKQTLASAVPYLLEEAHEAAEAVEAGDPAAARGELGDVVFQAVFLARLYQEEGKFALAQALEDVEAKMIRRHPHVFGPGSLDDAEAVRRQWGRIKEEERGGAPGGLLASLPRALPALSRAHRLGQRATRVSFDWDDAGQVWEKVGEELGELTAAQGDAAAEAELGDVLFSLAQWARHRGLDAEASLRRANARFTARFEFMERLAAAQGRDLAAMQPQEREELWAQAKAALAPGGVAQSSGHDD